jgi:hypothetical protein
MRRAGPTLTDVVVAVTLVLLLSTFSVVAAQAAKEADTVKNCASNLRQIGQAILLYSNENRGAYPRTGVAGDDKNPVPVWGTPYEDDKSLGAKEKGVDPFFPRDVPTGKTDPALSRYVPKPNDVSAAFFLLMRTQDIGADVFVCPETVQIGWDFGRTPGPNGAWNWTNWQGRKGLRQHLSYSYQNPYPSHAAIGSGFKLNNSVSAEFAVAADMNPGVDALLKLTPAAPPEAMRHGNSVNHARDGQNVLYGDGAVRFANNPFVGVRRDNIYTFGPSDLDAKPPKGGAGIIGAPAQANDSILLPTARALEIIGADGEVVPEFRSAPTTPEQAEAARQELVGRYERREPMGFAGFGGHRVIRLEITPKTIAATSGPITVTFAYQIVSAGEKTARLALSAEGTRQQSIHVTIKTDGGLTIRGTQYYEGEWDPVR